jgi:hypothetical protein
MLREGVGQASIRQPVESDEVVQGDSTTLPVKRMTPDPTSVSAWDNGSAPSIAIATTNGNLPFMTDLLEELPHLEYRLNFLFLKDYLIATGDNFAAQKNNWL